MDTACPWPDFILDGCSGNQSATHTSNTKVRVQLSCVQPQNTSSRGGWGSSATAVTTLWAARLRIVQFLTEEGGFTFLRNVKTGSEAQPAFPAGSKAAGG